VTLDRISSKRVLVRFDFNVPMKNGTIVNDFRIRQSLETIKKLLENDNKIIIVSHLGRPTEGVMMNPCRLNQYVNTYRNF
jgi:phosphoglycerate kinase